MPKTSGQPDKYRHHSYRSGQPAAARPRTGGGGPEVGLVTNPLLLGTSYLPLCRIGIHGPPPPVRLNHRGGAAVAFPIWPH